MLKDNLAFIHRVLGDLVRPGWDRADKCWAIARNHMRDIVEALAERYGSVKVTIDFRTTGKCDTRCRDAEHDDCDCQCLGENPGSAAYWRGWTEVGETALVEVGIARRTFLVTRP
ncbi:hypothetical protein HUT16_08355 [Kitasatospora sp. NA04385]|uniref:hypothetical protein n=1 Tax=Kitasatospora sp. NA04385 TaxID=2742135 RepID=UPI0015913C07|nr:hypothetical protein [Kitasatospora sp. NA04385]QKW19072.1 hypothetical protein HUT16_08355 [Kitasatospora sp. NA04385]